VKTLDLYIVKKTSLPLAAAVSIALLAMLLDKLVHVLDLVVNKGGPFVLLLEMMANLIPPYLGLALPAALFTGVLLAALRLSGDSELDAIQAAGVGLARLMLPIMAVAIVMMVGGFIIIGFLQPRAFYSYHSLVYLVTHTVWDATLERGDFFTGFGGKTILVDHISGSDRKLSGIFIYEPRPDGGSVTTTAQTGTVFQSVDSPGHILHLLHGMRVDVESHRQAKVVSFEQFDLPLEPDAAAAPPTAAETTLATSRCWNSGDMTEARSFPRPSSPPSSTAGWCGSPPSCSCRPWPSRSGSARAALAAAPS